MNTNTFTIDEVDIEIISITPSEVLSSHSGFNDYVKTISVVYGFRYVDVTLPDEVINTRIVLDLDATSMKSSQYIDFDNITKEIFYDLAIESARVSEKILNHVKFVRVRTGLDIEEPKKVQPPRRLKPFN